VTCWQRDRGDSHAWNRASIWTRPGYFFTAKGATSVWVPPTPATPDGFVLVVEGKDQNGKDLKREIYVDELEYSSTAIPSPYIPKEKHK
jgi:hypothetical protein